MAVKPPRNTKTAAKPVVPQKRSSSTTDEAPKPHKRQLVNGTGPRPSARSVEAQASQTTSSQSESRPTKTTPLQAYVCGDGEAGELGLGAGKKVTNVRKARLNPNLSNLQSLSTGGMHAAALTVDDRLLTWGVNDNGALGRNTQYEEKLRDMDAGSDDESDDEADLNPREATPTEVDRSNFTPGTKFEQVSAGDSATFALTTDGRVYGWGNFRDHNGLYGFTFDAWKTRPDENQPTPILLPTLTKIVQISAGADFCLALDRAGRVYAWGCGQQCELGRRLVERRRRECLIPHPVGIPRKYKIRSIHAASNHAFAIDQDGNTWTWGLNNFGQTGIRHNAGQNEAVVSIPTRVDSLMGQDMKMIAGGLHHSIGVTNSGKCLVWGRLDGDQSGLDMETLIQQHPDKLLMDSRGKPRALLEPVALPIPECRYVAAGSDHSLAVTTDGHAWSWGFNGTNQCGQNTSKDIKVATVMPGEDIQNVKITWAGAGGQYSMLAGHK